MNDPRLVLVQGELHQLFATWWSDEELTDNEMADVRAALRGAFPDPAEALQA